MSKEKKKNSFPFALSSPRKKRRRNGTRPRGRIPFPSRFSLALDRQVSSPFLPSRACGCLYPRRKISLTSRSRWKKIRKKKRKSEEFEGYKFFIFFFFGVSPIIFFFLGIWLSLGLDSENTLLFPSFTLPHPHLFIIFPNAGQKRKRKLLAGEGR